MTTETAYALTYAPDVPGDLVALVPGALGSQPRWEALLRGWGQALQDQEDDAFSLVVDDSLENASGQALDVWGRIVGEQRLQLQASDYRRIIAARMAGDLSNGTRDQLADLALKALNGDVVVGFDNYPAGYTLDVRVQALPVSSHLAHRVVQIVDDATEGGVRGQLVAYVEGAFALGTISATGAPVGPPVIGVAPLAQDLRA